jgi:hypothetical protein
MELASSSGLRSHIKLWDSEIRKIPDLLQDSENIPSDELEGEVAAYIWTIILESLISVSPGESLDLELLA